MPTASSSKPSRKETAKKPYDRNLPSSYTSLKAASTSGSTKDLGAPSTHGQKTRKGKKAWRKNIDVRDEEEALEQAREEERVTG
jgi:nucleolar protein 53